MNAADAVDLGREALMTCMVIGAPLLAVALVVGILVGMLQAMTQVQDQTVAFIPKIVIMAVVIGLGLPWLADRMLEYSQSMLEKPVIHSIRTVADE